MSKPTELLQDILETVLALENARSEAVTGLQEGLVERLENETGQLLDHYKGEL